MKKDKRHFNNQFATQKLREEFNPMTPIKKDTDIPYSDSEYQDYKKRHAARRQSTQDRVDALNWNRELMRGSGSRIKEEGSVTGAGEATLPRLTGPKKKIKETIKKVDGKYAVYPEKGGSRLGTHDTKEKAQKQLAAIEISKSQKESKERGTGKGFIYKDLWEMFNEEDADPKEGDSVKIQKKGSPQDGKIGKIVSITEPGAYNVDFNGKVYTFQETDFVIDKSGGEEKPEEGGEAGEETTIKPFSEGLGVPKMSTGTVTMGGGKSAIYIVTDEGQFLYVPTPEEYQAFVLSGKKVQDLLATSWLPKAKPYKPTTHPMATLGQGKGHHIDERLNENYSRFKNETKTRSKGQQMHEALKLAKKKIHEVNRILEYTSQLKSELFEGDSEYNHHSKKVMERMTTSIAEAYSKLKKLK